MNPRDLLVYVSMLLLVPGLAFGQLNRTGDGYELSLLKRYETRRSGALTLKISGAVEVSAWEKPVVEIREVTSIDSDDAAFAEAVQARSRRSYGRAGSRVRVSLVEAAPGVRRRYEIRVPRAFDVSLRTGGDDVSVVGITGDLTLAGNGGLVRLREIGGRVGIRTSDGAIDLAQVYGDVRVSMSAGRIEIREADGDVRLDSGEGEITLAAIGGRIRIDGGDVSVRSDDLRGAVDVGVQTGDVELLDVAGPVEVGTGEGCVRVRLHPDGTAVHAVKLHTTEGRIDLALPVDFAADVRAELWQIGPRGTVDPGLIEAPASLLRRTEEPEPGRRLLIASGKLAGGGSPVFLKSYGGPIVLTAGSR